MAMLFENLGFFFLLMLLLLTSGGAGGDATMMMRMRCRENERQALLHFKQDLVDEFGLLSSWGSSQQEEDCCKWRGIRCSNRTGHVIVLDLHYFGVTLSGKVSPSLLELKHLKYLDLSDNSFVGTIPHQLGNLTNLRSLHLGFNHGQLSVKNLEWLSHLRLLRHLDLSGVNLENTTDWLQQIYKLSFLTELHLSGCGLPGTSWSPLLPLTNSSSIPPLAILDLSSNNFSGSLPDLTRFPSLRELRLGFNQLNRPFPQRFGQISSLVILDFSYNKIPGSFPDLTLFPSLRELHLNNNQLEGTIYGAYLSNLSKLKILDLSFNSLVLDVPSDWAPPFQLEIIRLAYCNLGTHFPKWLQSQTNFSVLDISGAGISDTIPHWFWDLSPRLQYLNISHNQIHGVIPDLSLKFVEFATIDLSSNHINGLIPSLPPKVSLLQLSKNMFTGSVLNLCTTAHKSLFFLDLSDNQLSGELPDCWMCFESLSFLNLANNNFYGKVPTSIGFLHGLLTLQLRNNNLIGELPSSLKNCSYLRLIDLSENKVSGEVPTWLGTHLTNLTVISLRNNEFFGSIPPHICYLSYAQVLDLSQNYISGNIPLCFDNLTSLVQSSSSNAFQGLYGPAFSTIAIDYVVNALVQWKGKDSEYGKTPGLLKVIDLSSNKLAGKIPQEFASLQGLVSLNLSSNNLTGNVLQKIDHMKMLESLDLSRNHLSGEIPIGLASLTFLSVLDLSNNNFSGKIPSSTQLQGFNASVYAGNDKLCGLPLPSKCPQDDTNLLPTPVGHDKDNKNEEDEDRFVTLVFYLSVVLGFTLGFWGIFGPIMLHSSWRRAYFKFLDKIKDWIYGTTAVNMARLQRKLKS